MTELIAILTLSLTLVLWYDRQFWSNLANSGAPWPVYGASFCVLALLWQAEASVLAPLSIHFLGLTTVLLLFGLRLACLMALLLSLFGYVYSGWSVESALWTGCAAIWTLMFNAAVVWWVFKKLPHQLFIYLFITAFLNAALASSLFLFVKSIPAWQLLSSQQVVDSYLVFIPLVALPEALLNGMAMTLMVIYKPEWVKTFSQRDYLDQPH